MVPLLGQQFSVLSYALMPTLQCECERKGVVTLMLQHRAAGIQKTQEACPSCGKLFTIQAVQVAPDGRLQFAIEIAISHAVAMD